MIKNISNNHTEMDDFLLKYGSNSIILGPGHYGDFITKKTNKLLKVTLLNSKNKEFKYLDIIRSIPKYTKYYSIPEEANSIIYPNDKFYKIIKNLTSDIDINIFENKLHCCYIEFAGEYELLDTINQVFQLGDLSFWKSYKFIYKFTVQMLEAIYFLHERQICHLDIKPENILVNGEEFRIIDFGFSSKYPFNDFVDNYRGTPGYFPKYYPKVRIEPWFPKIEANDTLLFRGEIPIKKYRNLVYRIDSYCLGRILFMIRYLYEDNKVYLCCNFEKKIKTKIDIIIGSLLKNNIYDRLSIRELYLFHKRCSSHRRIGNIFC